MALTIGRIPIESIVVHHISLVGDVIKMIAIARMVRIMVFVPPIQPWIKRYGVMCLLSCYGAFNLAQCFQSDSMPVC